jgi:hypothetical protein
MTARKINHSESGATTFEGGPTDSAEASLLEPKTLDFFLYIAGEAKHWDWTPPIEGLYQFTNEQKGRFTHLKQCGLLVVEEIDDDNHQIFFTDKGAILAKEHGIEIIAMR